MKLNLGCGNDVRNGYINCDNGSSNQLLANAKILKVDLLEFPWPFESNSADEILMNHVLEHMPDAYAVMR